MCLAIFKPGGKSIPSDNLTNGWIRNPDGGGFAYYADGKLEVSKGFNKFKDFLKEYEKAVVKYPDAPFLVHFRIRSMGDKSPENTHPHVYKHGALIHNGTLSGVGAKPQEGKSDTALFVEKFGDNLTYERLSNNKEAFEQALSWNKVVILFNDGKHLIFHEKIGVWRDGVWYSNAYSLQGKTMAEAYGCNYE